MNVLAATLKLLMTILSRLDLVHFNLCGIYHDAAAKEKFILTKLDVQNACSDT